MGVQVETPVRTQRIRPLELLVGLVVLVTAVVVLLGSDHEVRDRRGQVTVSVPLTWTDRTSPEAGRWVGEGEFSYREPDLRAGHLLGERSVAVTIDARERGLAELHQAQVDVFCVDWACVDRGQPVAVEVNGRRGLEQVLAHAGQEWTVLLTLESDRSVVSVAARAGELSGPRTVEAMGRIARTTVIRD